MGFKENDHFFWFEGHVSAELLSSSVEWRIAKRVECWMGSDADWGGWWPQSVKGCGLEG